MSRRAQDRIRTYFYKTKEELLRSKDLPQARLQSLLTELRDRLKLNNYHGCYFDRARHGDEDMRSMCDPSGRFTCGGRWDRAVCLYEPPHGINPYSSREARIIFQTWNLDHGRERARAVVPAVCAALRACDFAVAANGKVYKGIDSDSVLDGDRVSLDVKGIYNDLFTIANLKIVHIVCHDKGAHSSLKAGPYLL